MELLVAEMSMLPDSIRWTSGVVEWIGGRGRDRDPVRIVAFERGFDMRISYKIID